MSLSFNIEKIKQEGLTLDFAKIKAQGTLALLPEDAYRLKTYGFCTQKHPGYFILRVRIPGGVLTAHALKGLSEIIETYGRGTAHLTVRQGLEMRFVRVEDVEEIFEKLHAIGLSSRSTDGHTVRNIMACPHGGIVSEGRFSVEPWAQSLSDYFVQQSDPINRRLPNRLNIFFSACPECNAYAMIQDIAFVAVTRESHPLVFGFEVWIGGSLGPSPSLGFKVKDFIPVADALSACRALVTVYTRFSSDGEKSAPRLKDKIKPWGQERFISAFEEAFEEEKTQSLPCPPLPSEKQPVPLAQFFEAMASVFPTSLPAGSRLQRQKGYARLILSLPFGDIRASALVTLGRIAKRYGNGMIYLTPRQEIELHWIPIRKITSVLRALSAVGLSLKTGKEAHLIACSGIEFCALAHTHAQGTAREIGRVLKSNDPERDSFLKSLSVHISGCQNGCARHPISDIGLAGEAGDNGTSYRLYLGGRAEGHSKIGTLIRGGIPESQIVPVIETIIKVVLEHRQKNETFHDVVTRIKPETIAMALETKVTTDLPQDDLFIMSPMYL